MEVEQKMKTWIEKNWKLIKNHRGYMALTLALMLSLGGYEIVKPAAASAATAAPAAPALDDNSVSALLTLDRAMETLAAHVTPAVVNVTVAARHKVQAEDQEQDGGDIQKFFGPFGFGGPQMPQNHRGPQIEHGLGSGIIISPDGYIVKKMTVVDRATHILTNISNHCQVNAKSIGSNWITDLE